MSRNFTIVVLILLKSFLFSCSSNDPEPGLEIAQLAKSDKYIYDASISPDGKSIFYLTGDNEVHSLTTEGKNHLLLVREEGIIDRVPSISQSGMFLSYVASKQTETGSMEELILFDVNSKERKVLLEEDEIFNTYSFVDNDQKILFNKYTMIDTPEGRCSCNTIWSLPISGGAATQISGDNNATVMDVSNDGRILVDTYTEVYSMNLNGGEIVELGEYTTPITFSPDGDFVLSRQYLSVHDPNTNKDVQTSELFLINISDKEKTQITHFNARSFPIGFSPDGKKILFMSNMDRKHDNGDSQNELYLINTDGSNLVRLTNNEKNEGGIGFIEGGSKVLFYFNGVGDGGFYSVKIN